MGILPMPWRDRLGPGRAKRDPMWRSKSELHGRNSDWEGEAPAEPLGRAGVVTDVITGIRAETWLGRSLALPSSV